MVDLHCHLLPGVDDGPATMPESLAYAASAVAAGTRTIVATPHVELIDVHELDERVTELRAALQRAGVALEVRRGGELKPESIGTLDQDDLELIAHGPAGARWLLYEVPLSGVDGAFLDGARELRARGFGLLLAHPERSRGILDGGLDALAPQLAEGALVAANVDPLQGGEGAVRHRAAQMLMRADLPTVIVTDAHPPHRPFTLAMAATAIIGTTGRAELAVLLTSLAPARLLEHGMPRARAAA